MTHSQAHLSTSVHVAASPHRVYALLSDLPRMGEWSPECTGVRWRGDLRAPVEGARFIGHNRRGLVRWSTFGEVVLADPGRDFAFEVTVGPVKVARWAYRLQEAAASDGGADGSGCIVVEEWTDRRAAPIRLPMERAMGSRAASNLKGMRTTLQRLKQAAERSDCSI